MTCQTCKKEVERLFFGRCWECIEIDEKWENLMQEGGD